MEDNEIASVEAPAENAKPVDFTREVDGSKDYVKAAGDATPSPRHFVLKVDPADFEITSGII